MRLMLSMLILPNLGKGCPYMVEDFGGVRQCISELRQAVYTKPLIICGVFASILNLNFGFPNFGGRTAPMVMGISVVRQGVSELLQAIYTKL